MDILKPHHTSNKASKLNKKGKKNTLFYSTDAPTSQLNFENSPKTQSSINLEKNQTVKVCEPTTTYPQVNTSNVTIEKTCENFGPKDLVYLPISEFNQELRSDIQKSQKSQTFDAVKTPKNAKRKIDSVNITPVTSKVANTNATNSTISSNSDSESIDVDDEQDQYQIVIHDKQTKSLQAKVTANNQSIIPSTSNSQEDISDTTHAIAAKITNTTNNELALFIRGKYTSIVSLIQTKPVSFRNGFNKNFGVPNDLAIHYRSDCIKITSFNQEQYDKIYQATSMHGVEIEVTLPRIRTEYSKDTANIVAYSNMAEKPIHKVVIHRVNTDIDERDIEHETGATSAIRITRKDNNTSNRIPTQTVILAYISTPPSTVNIGFLQYKTEVYIPNPMRCNNCQHFGHTTNKCKTNTIICSYCTKNHAYQDCTTRQQNLPPICRNCGGAHSAAFNQCPTFLQVKDALTVRATQNISYKQALTKVKTNLSTTSPSMETQNTIVATAAHTQPTIPHISNTTSHAQQQYKATEQTILHIAPGLTDLLTAFTHTLTQIIQQLPPSTLHTSLIQQLHEATQKFAAQPIAFTSTITSDPKHIPKQYTPHIIHHSTATAETPSLAQTLTQPIHPDPNLTLSPSQYPPLPSNHGHNT